MANLVYPNYLKLLVSGTVDLINDRVFAMLLSGSYVPHTGHTLIADVSGHQSSDSLGSYPRGGVELTSKTVSYSSSQALYDAADITITNSTLSASGCAIWVSGGTPATNYLVKFIDIGNQSSTNGTFQIIWNNSNGIFKIGAS